MKSVYSSFLIVLLLCIWYLVHRDIISYCLFIHTHSITDRLSVD